MDKVVAREIDRAKVMQVQDEVSHEVVRELSAEEVQAVAGGNGYIKGGGRADGN